MKYFPLPRRLAVGILACAAASGSGALTLGRVQGLALVGRPLEITVPVLFESNGETVPECADAQVFYGDTRLPQGRITTQIDSSGAGATVRVRASAAINEPVVTVYLNVGCKDRSTRRIVLLSEQPDPRSEAAVRPVPLAQAVTEERPGAAPAPAVRSPRRARTAAPGADTTAGSAETGPATAEPPPGRSPRVARPARSPGPVAATQPRLKLEPLDLSAPPGEPTLRMSGMMAPPPANAAEQRALAGAMWRSLNARPEDLMREVQRLEALEKDLGSLRLSIQRNEQALSEVRAQLHKAESERYANPLVYALALLALLALVAAAWAVRRSGRNVAAGSSPWWRPEQDSVDSEAPMERAGPPSVVRAPQPVPSRDSQDSAAPVADRLAPKQVTPPPPRPAQEFSPSMRGDDFRASNTAGVRALRAEELHDVQQEADFFISLGEFDRAIEVLRRALSGAPAARRAFTMLVGVPSMKFTTLSKAAPKYSS
jgi:pilus assembly protein FimV